MHVENIFATCGENVNEQLTVCCVGCTKFSKKKSENSEKSMIKRDIL